MRILIAEDENSTRLMLQRTLEKWGHDVTAVENGVAALETFKREPFSIVITDWVMPKMDGLELVKQIRALEQKDYVYIIMLTGKSEKGDLVAGMAAGADDFGTKPVAKDELHVRLRAGERIIRLKENLSRRNHELEELNRRMKSDLEAAAEIQKSLLPSAPPKSANANIDWRFIPSDELAGDILNAFNLDEESLGFYVLDVSGHGVPAALLAVTLSRMLSSTIDQASLLKSRNGTSHGYQLSTPAQVANQLNARFQLNPENGQYFTFVYGLFNKQTRVLNYVSAGHPGMIYLPHNAEDRILESPSLPIGFTESVDYEEHSLQLCPGDRLYMYSDGIPEAANVDDELFGGKRMLQTLKECREQPLSQSLDYLLEKLNDWCQSPKFKDDVSLLAIEICDD